MADDLVISLFYPFVCPFCSVLPAWSEDGYASRGNCGTRVDRSVGIKICSPVVTRIDGIDDVPLYAVLVG